MVAHIHTVAFSGISPVDVDVQVHVTSGLPYFGIVGLPDKAIGESKDRVKSALNSIGLAPPSSRITVNLAPADLMKEGSHYDLAIAIGLAVEMNIIPQDAVNNYIVLGELSLDGKIAPIPGVLPASIHAVAKNKGIICPTNNAKESCWSGNKDILAPNDLISLVNHIKGTQILSPQKLSLNHSNDNNPPKYPDMKDIKGQQSAKRALEIAAAGNHNLLMIGPPGSGKSMLASRLRGIVPELNSEEVLSISMISSLNNSLEYGRINHQRPYRDPHHSCSVPAMVGGGKKAKPGEVTLAHNGVLFLDELPEFPKSVLESLRQPIETGQISVARANAHVTYPANFQLVAAMNPCKCGYLGDPARSCSKAPKCGLDYQSKISGPLFDRIDIHIDVPAVTPREAFDAKTGESSTSIAKRVLAARNIQQLRYSNNKISTNSKAEGELLNQHTQVDEETHEILMKAFNTMQLSMRGYNRVLRVARTIADLEDCPQIKKHHVIESLSYRRVIYKNSS